METPDAQEQQDWQDLLGEHYETLYRNHKHDSPEHSRISLIRRIATLAASQEELNILNIGSGPQSLETQLRRSHKDKAWYKNSTFFTVDYADIQAKKLLAISTSNIYHIRASGLHLPFQNDAFDLIISNHAIEFIPGNAIFEAARVLNADGKFIFYFHHPSMLDSINDSINPRVGKFWNYLQSEQILFETPEQIAQTLMTSHLAPSEIILGNDGVDKWWEVIGKKRSDSSNL